MMYTINKKQTKQKVIKQIDSERQSRHVVGLNSCLPVMYAFYRVYFAHLYVRVHTCVPPSFGPLCFAPKRESGEFLLLVGVCVSNITTLGRTNTLSVHCIPLHTQSRVGESEREVGSWCERSLKHFHLLSGHCYAFLVGCCYQFAVNQLQAF